MLNISWLAVSLNFVSGNYGLVVLVVPKYKFYYKMVLLLLLVSGSIKNWKWFWLRHVLWRRCQLNFQITDFGSAKIVRNDGKRVKGERRRRRTGDNRDGEKDSDADTRLVYKGTWYFWLNRSDLLFKYLVIISRLRSAPIAFITLDFVVVYNKESVANVYLQNDTLCP